MPITKTKLISHTANQSNAGVVSQSLNQGQVSQMLAGSGTAHLPTQSNLFNLNGKQSQDSVKINKQFVNNTSAQPSASVTQTTINFSARSPPITHNSELSPNPFNQKQASQGILTINVHKIQKKTNVSVPTQASCC